MRRFLMGKLIDWAQREDRKPLILRGARQVGKTTLVRMLADDLNLILIEINMEDQHSFLPLLNDRSKAKEILELILLERGISDSPENILFFFDEAQQSEDLYPYLRYFYENAPEYRVIAAGSLFDLEIKRADRAQGPTGRVEYVYLEPMSFSEYLMAANSVAYKKYIELDTFSPVPEALHNVYSKLFREYLVLGGLPAVVQAGINNESMLRIDEIKSNILRGYIEDLPKYSDLAGKKYDPKLLESIINVVYGRPSNSYAYSKIAPDFKSQVVRKHMEVLNDAKIIRISLHSNENLPPLSLGVNTKKYKLFGLDIGLCYTFMRVPLANIYTSTDMNSEFNGAIAEQYIAQAIQAQSYPHNVSHLYHWDNPARGGVAEVDFLIESQGKVIPVECKSGKSGKMKSLQVLLESKPYESALRVYSGNVEIEEREIRPRSKNGSINAELCYQNKLHSIPHYLFDRYIQQTR